MRKTSKNHFRDLEMLTLVIAGSVDDGKSTFIGRLLYDCGQIYKDQINAVKKISPIGDNLDFSLFTDGLSSEREQKITIDVAYRYFSTGKRRFVVADVPGHEQYTRNMVTGASKADVALIIIDVQHGLTEQTKRHLFIASLLGISHIAVIVNKMDLIDFKENEFVKIKTQCLYFTQKLFINDLTFFPCSAIEGDMIVKRSTNMSWFKGTTIFDYLQNVNISSATKTVDFRFPVQYVLRPNQDFRGYAGKIEGGSISVGERVIILPSSQESSVKQIYLADKKVKRATSPRSIILTLNNERDISRGDMLVQPDHTPNSSQYLQAIVCWFDTKPLEPGARYRMKHTTNDTFCFVDKVLYVINMNTLHRQVRVNIKFNEIGQVIIQTQRPIFFDLYLKNKATGSFIIIDESTNNTVGAGMITANINYNLPCAKSLSNQTIPSSPVGAVIWLTGLSSAGKSTIAEQLFAKLKNKGVNCEWLDGDIFREELNIGLTYTRTDRRKNILIAGFIARQLANHRVIVIASFISPYRDQRLKLKKECSNFIEVYVKASLKTCAKRDVKGFYKRAKIKCVDNFTGISHPYEAPTKPDVILDTESYSIQECANRLWLALESRSII